MRSARTRSRHRARLGALLAAASLALLPLRLAGDEAGPGPKRGWRAVVLGSSGSATTLRLARVRGSSEPQEVEEVPLAECASPSVRQRGGPAAAQHVSDLALGEVVAVRPQGGADGRAAVLLGGVSLCEPLLRAGLAWVRPESRASARLAGLEREAREARRGLWADEDPVAPWEWQELILLRDEVHRRVHRGWECPWVAETQCQGCAGRFNDLDEALRAGYEPHDCLTPALRRLAASSAPYSEPPPAGAPPPLPPHERRACARDAECAFAPFPPCTCPGCGALWETPVRAEVAQRMRANFARARCLGIPCPACATTSLGDRARCVEGQCRVEGATRQGWPREP